MNSFTYIRAKNLKNASALLKKAGAMAAPLAGGTDLLGLMKDSVFAPDTVVSLSGLTGMDTISYESGKGLTIGAMARVAELAEHHDVQHRYPAISQAAREVASPQLRNMATVGGNLCQRPRCWYFRGEFPCLRKGGDICYAVDGQNKYHCVVNGGPCFIVHPSDLAVPLLALNASVVIFDGKKERSVPISDFYVLPQIDVTRETILKPGELVTAVKVPEERNDLVCGYLKFKERGAWDFAVVSVAMALQMDDDQIHSARVTLGGVSPIPYLDEEVSAALKGVSLAAGDLDGPASLALQNAEPLAQNEYKIILARNLIKKLLRQLRKKE